MTAPLLARRLLLVHATMLGTGAGVFAVRWALDPAWAVPAGLVVLGAAAAVVGIFRRPFAAFVGVAAAVLVGTHQLDALGAGAGGYVWLLVGVLALTIASGLGAVVAQVVGGRGARTPLPYASWAQAGALLLLAPVCAEYLSAYDDSTGHPWQLVGNLVIFVPLYGAAALLIREVARRTGIGWIGILALGVAFGVVQAGLVDQSLFSPDYRAIEGWEESYRATLVEPLGLSASNALGFVSGHAIASIAAPIALVEAARPAAVHRPWLHRPGLTLVALAYVAASVLVLRFHLQTETWHAAPAQLVGAGCVALACVAFALLVARRPRSPRPGRQVRLPVLLAVALPLGLVNASLPQTWVGVLLGVAVLSLAAVGVVTLSRRPGWTPTHAAMVAAAPLLATACLAFTYPPLVGEVSASAKYAHNAVMATIVVAATVLAVRRRGPAPTQVEAGPAPAAPVEVAQDGRLYAARSAANSTSRRSSKPIAR